MRKKEATETERCFIQQLMTQLIHRHKFGTLSQSPCGWDRPRSLDRLLSSHAHQHGVESEVLQVGCARDSLTGYTHVPVLHH